MFHRAIFPSPSTWSSWPCAISILLAAFCAAIVSADDTFGILAYTANASSGRPNDVYILANLCRILSLPGSGARSDPSAISSGGGHGIIGSGRSTASSAEANQAREWKLDALVDLLDELELPQIIIHVGGLTALDAVVYKLVSKGLEAIPLVIVLSHVFWPVLKFLLAW